MVGPTWLSRRCWRIHRAAICILAFTAVFAACQADRTPELLGAWQATLLVEEGDTIEVILDDVGLFFDEEGKYIYTSTLDYEESGIFRTKGNLLFTTPVKQDTLVERPVAIALLNEKALHLNMKEGDKNRILEFERITPDATEEDELHDGHDHDGHGHEGHDHDEVIEENEYDTAVDTTNLDEVID
ncbi:MAG: hypothetical protein AB8F78_11145 [Saprospiraceae bacterium]